MSALDRAFIKAFAKDTSRYGSANLAPSSDMSPAIAANRDVVAATIPIASSRAAPTIGKPHFARKGVENAAYVDAVAVARPMTDADRRAFELASGEFNQIELASELPGALPGTARHISIGRTEKSARTDAASRIPAPHFAVAEASKTAPFSPIRVDARASDEELAELPRSLRIPSIPLPRSKSDSVAENQGASASDGSQELFQGWDDKDAVEAEASSDSAFTPVWEVDRYVWPAVCDKLRDDWAPALQTVVESICELADENGRPDDGERLAPIVAVVSFGRGEGRTTTSACLARSCAQAGLRTCLIDGDFENPQLASVLGLNSLAGWEDVMLANLPLEEAAVLSIDDRFTLLPALRARPAAELYGTRKTHKALAGIAAQFDLVVIDLGPIVEDRRGAYQSIERCPFDAAVMVRDLRWTTESQLREAVGHIESLEAPILAIVENFADSRLPPADSRRLAGRERPTGRAHLE